MTLKITLQEKINGYWDFGAKKIFNWDIDGKPQKNKNGFFVKVGSWEANNYFTIGCGKTKLQTNKQILSNLKCILLKRLATNNIKIKSAIII